MTIVRRKRCIELHEGLRARKWSPPHWDSSLYCRSNCCSPSLRLGSISPPCPMSSSKDAWRFSTQLPHDLIFLANPISSYFSANPPYNNVILQALIFTPPPQPPHILLLQCAGGTDPHAFSAFWQVPSGSLSLSDQTLLHAMASIIHEQTGLQLSYVVTMSGTEIGPKPNAWTGRSQWMRMLFMVEVVELRMIAERGAKSPEEFAFDEDSEYGDQGSDISQEPDLDAVNVTMNPEKHRLHVWATEEDLREFIKSGLYPIEETAQYQVMLEAFAFYRQDFAQLNYLRQQRQGANSSHGFGP